MENNIKNRGFASMTIEQRTAIATKGGLSVSGNKEWMAKIGQIGGKRSVESRRQKKNEKATKQP